MKIRPGEASRLSGPATVRIAACGDSLPPPLRKPGSLGRALQPGSTNAAPDAGAQQVDSADFGPFPEACARLPFRLLNGDPVAKGKCRKRWRRGFRAAVGCDCSRRGRRQSLRHRTPGNRPPAEFCTAFSPPPEPGSTTQRHTHRCVIKRVQRGVASWEGNRRGRCGNAVWKREMLWRDVENVGEMRVRGRSSGAVVGGLAIFHSLSGISLF
jgi:hypothetical protein